MVRDVQPVENAIVTRSNKLIEARYKLKLNEQKVMYAVISLVQPEDKEFHKYRFKIAELAKFCGIHAKSAYRDMEEVTRGLLTRVLTIKEGQRTLQTHWVQSALYDVGVVEFELDYKLKPYLLGLKENFTKVNVKELMKFKCQYSGRIYELLFQHLNFKIRRFPISELRDLIGLAVDEYPAYNDVRRFILEPSVKDINKNTPIEVSFETEKEGKKIAYIIFNMKMKPPKKDECLGSNMFEEPQAEIKSAEDQGSATITKTLVQQFKDYKIAKEKIAEYIAQYDEDYCMAQLDHLRERLVKAKDGGKPIAVIPKWMDSCMKGNYAKYKNPDSEAAVVYEKENPKPKKPKADCAQCKGTGWYEVTLSHETSPRTQICDCKNN